jgi:hypothetical protein
MKWVYFLLSLVALFFANNTLFIVPEKYDSFTVVAASAAIVIGAIFAWSSSKRFVKSTLGLHVSWKKLVMAPPALVWLFVMFLFCLVGLTKMVPRR